MKRTKIVLLPTLPPQQTLTQRVTKALGYITLGIIVYIMMIVVAFEFMAGCGTTTYNADGTYYTNECLFIPYEPVQGMWK